MMVQKDLILDQQPLIKADQLTRLYGINKGCEQIDLELHAGEVLGIVGESGSGKSTLLRCLAGIESIDSGTVDYESTIGQLRLHDLAESERRRLIRQEWGFIQQNPRDGLHLEMSAGANISERLMSQGERHYGRIRQQALDWMQRVELDPARIDDKPKNFSGGMQQRLQIARNLVSGPSILFMDEPTGGLDVSVQARVLDLIRKLVRELNVAVVLVTHDIGVARILADRLIVMRNSRIIETGLTDQILEDPQAPYTQLLVSSILRV
ncbi:MAG: putative phosphonate transport system ATP-binding protein [Pseudomonadales bacterium]|jgi:putative phosphonate transport system ATP-binding protein